MTPRIPRVYTFIVYSKDRTMGMISDYYVSMPQIEALTNGGDRPDYYELYLDRICGKLEGADAAAADGGTTGFVQLALDLSAPYKHTSQSGNNIFFVIPVVQSGTGIYAMDSSSRTVNPIVISAQGISSQLHVQLYDDNGVLMTVANTKEHVIVLTIKERMAAVVSSS